MQPDIYADLLRLLPRMDTGVNCYDLWLLSGYNRIQNGTNADTKTIKCNVLIYITFLYI
jgi:hypothetical protein